MNSDWKARAVKVEPIKTATPSPQGDWRKRAIPVQREVTSVQTSPVPEEGFLKQGARQVGRTAKNVLAGTLGTAGDIAGLGINAAGWGAGKLLGKEGAAWSVPSTSETIKEAFDIATGGSTKPRTGGEKNVDTALEFASSLGLGPLARASGIVKAAAPLAKGVTKALRGETIGQKAADLYTARSPQEIVSAAAAGAASSEAENRGEGALAQVLSGLGAGALGHAVGPLANPFVKVAKAALTPKETFKSVKKKINTPGELKKVITEPFRNPIQKAAASVLRPTQKQLRSDVLESAERLGVDLPASAVTDKRAVRGIDSALAASTWSGSSYENLMNKVSDDLIDHWSKTLNKISPIKYESKKSAGAAIKESLVAEEKTRRNINSKLYEEASELLPLGAAQDARPIIQEIDSTLRSLNKTFKRSTEQEGVYNKLLDIRKRMAAHGNSVPVEGLIATKQSLNEIINWETVGGSKQLLKGLNNKIKDAIYKYGERDPEFIRAFSAAERDHGDLMNLFRNDIINSMADSAIPEYTLSKLTTPSSVQLLEQAIGRSPKGKEVVGAVKRYKLQDLLENKLVDKASGKFRHESAASALSPKAEDAEMIRALMSPEDYKKLQDIQKVTEGISSGAKQFSDSSKSASNIKDFAGLAALVGALAKGVFYWNPGTIVAGITAASAPWALAKLMTNKKFVTNLSNASKAYKKGNKRAFTNNMRNVLTITSKLSKERGKEEK